MNEASKTRQEAEDERLVDLVSAVLVDPNLHTDLRMRVQEEIRELLQPVRASAPAAAPGRPHQPERGVAGDHVPDLLQTVLSDPNLHTDMRMRLHQEISRLVGEAQ